MRRIIVLVLIVLSAACGANAPPSPAYAPPAMGTAETGTVASALTSDAAEGDDGYFKRAAGKRKSTSADASSGAAQGVSLDQKLVKNAWLTVRLRDKKLFEEAVDRVEHVARRLDGYVSNKSSSSITFKIPTGRLDEALAAVAELGKVTHRDVTAVDVTANYLDLAIRIDNLRKLRDRLGQLLEKAQTVQEILEVEKELGRVTSQLEALEGQMRLLENQTSYATVSVSFVERVRPGPIGWVFYGLYHGVKWLFVWD